MENIETVVYLKVMAYCAGAKLKTILVCLKHNPTREGADMKLYSYNQLRSIYGDTDAQVILIRKHIESIGYCESNITLEAFRRIDNVAQANKGGN